MTAVDDSIQHCLGALETLAIDLPRFLSETASVLISWMDFFCKPSADFRGATLKVEERCLAWSVSAKTCLSGYSCRSLVTLLRRSRTLTKLLHAMLARIIGLTSSGQHGSFLIFLATSFAVHALCL